MTHTEESLMALVATFVEQCESDALNNVIIGSEQISKYNALRLAIREVLAEVDRAALLQQDEPVSDSEMAALDSVIYGGSVTLDGKRIDPTSVYAAIDAAMKDQP